MLQAILTGKAQFGIAALASATPLVREGKVRGVAMVGSHRFPLYPDIPTLEELGIAGFEDGGFFLLIAPTGLPRRLTDALNRALVASLTAPDIRDRMLLAGHDPVQGPNTPDHGASVGGTRRGRAAHRHPLAALTRPTACWTDVPARVHAGRAGFKPAKQAT
jgi:Tripartite tricarboxylate transporter family receptor